LVKRFRYFRIKKRHNVNKVHINLEKILHGKKTRICINCLVFRCLKILKNLINIFFAKRTVKIFDLKFLIYFCSIELVEFIVFADVTNILITN